MKSFISKFLVSVFQKSLIPFYILTIFCCNTVCGQGCYFRNGGKSKVPDKHKYGFCIREENGTLKPRKKDVINIIQNAKKDTGMYVTANKKILSYFPIEDSTNANAIQCVQGIFKVVNIEKKNDNYYVKDNHLKKTTLFMYDIEQDCPKQSSLKYIRILVFQHEFGDYLKKMKKGHYYYLTLTPFLQKDCCSPTVINGDTTYRLRQSRGLYTYIIKGVLVPYFSFGDYNFVEISEIANNDKERKMQIEH